jgi:DNA end-binding protein Ku
MEERPARRLEGAAPRGAPAGSRASRRETTRLDVRGQAVRRSWVCATTSVRGARARAARAARNAQGHEPRTKELNGDMAHAIWSGSITFGLVTIPVKLYSAIRADELHFNYLHKDDLGRIRYERVCELDGKKVGWGDIVRGYEYEKGEYVVLSDEDFEKASPEASQSVEIVEFVDLKEIDPVFFDVPYYLEPEKKGRHAYAVLREALKRSGKVGIARVVMRTREHLAALKPDGQALVIELMHWADEVVPPRDLELPDEADKLPAAEMKMATMLIDTMSARFQPGDFKDRYRDEVMALIEARAQGRAAPRAKGKVRAPTNVLDLADVLQKSVAEISKRGPAKARAGRRPARGKRPRRAA